MQLLPESQDILVEFLDLYRVSLATELFPWYFQDFQGFLNIGHSEGSAIVTSHIWSKKKLELLNRYVDEMNQDQAVKKNESTVSEICYEYWYTGWIANHK